MDKIFNNLGASNHKKEGSREEDDFYTTDSNVVDEILKREKLYGQIWEPACGNGAISKILVERGYNVFSSDKFERGYGSKIDFLTSNMNVDFIITNPPYKLATEFILKALQSIKNNGKVIMLLKLLFLEGQYKYKILFKDNPPKTIYVFSYRTNCYINDNKDKSGGAVCYAWYVWEKGFKGEPVIRWINKKAVELANG